MRRWYRRLCGWKTREQAVAVCEHEKGRRGCGRGDVWCVARVGRLCTGKGTGWEATNLEASRLGAEVLELVRALFELVLYGRERGERERERERRV